MEKMKKYGKHILLAVIALALVITAVAVAGRPDHTGAALPGNNVADKLGGNVQDNDEQLHEESPADAVDINKGTADIPGGQNTLPIKQKTTWEAIGSFPIKYADMPLSERRDLVVDFFNFSKTALWTPKETLSYYTSSGRTDYVTMHQEAVYGGVPYMTVSSGSVYRLMDFMDEATGTVDVAKFMMTPAVNGIYPYDAMQTFAGQCSYNSYWGWARVLNSAEYDLTYDAVPNRNFILLGDYYDEITYSTRDKSGKVTGTYTGLDDLVEWTADTDQSNTNNANLSNYAINTMDVCKALGEQKMYASYAKLLKGDGLVYVTTAGHFAMCTMDAHVDGTAGAIDGTNSYITISDQTGTWTNGYNEQGDWFNYENGVDQKITFKDMFDHHYIPFTFGELIGTDPVEETWVSFTHSGNTITKSQLFSASVSANYGISDVYVIVTDNAGKEVYRHMVRALKPSTITMPIYESVNESKRDVVDTLGTLTAGTYHVEIEVQLGTGERPTVYTGTLKV